MATYFIFLYNINHMTDQDQSREGVTLSKFLQLFKLLLPKNTKTLARLDKFTDLDLGKIRELKGVDIKGIILDIDGCISFNHGEILKENVEHIGKLIGQGIKIVIYSNMAKTSRYDVLDSRVVVLTNVPPKPEKAGFEEACRQLGLPKENIVMVGDNYVTDGGAISAGINFIEIKPLRKEGESIFEKVHSAIRLVVHWISLLHDRGRK